VIVLGISCLILAAAVLAGMAAMIRDLHRAHRADVQAAYRRRRAELDEIATSSRGIGGLR
jgi:hypothetical protein